MALAFYPPSRRSLAGASGGQPSVDGIHELAAPSRYSTTVTSRLVVSYTTFSPLPPFNLQLSIIHFQLSIVERAVVFFYRHLLSPTASTFRSGVSCAARTFLSCTPGTSGRPGQCFLGAKLRKVERKTKEFIHFFAET